MQPSPDWFDPQQRHRELGQYFYPCGVAAGMINYFGHYIAGTFRDEVNTSDLVVSWADSRRGCYSAQTDGGTVTKGYHQHVYAQGAR